MVKEYRGDTFIFNFSFEDATIKFKAGDIIRLGIKKSVTDTNYILYKSYTLDTEADEVQFRFETEETKDITPGEYILEVETKKDGIVETPYREIIKIVGDVVNDDQLQD